MTDFQLRIQKGPEPGKVIPLTSASVTIGRDPMVEITIDDVEVSRQHTRLARTLNSYQVHDLGSTNGTYLDGVRLGGEAVTLQPGQILSLGSGVSIIFQTVADEKDEAVILATMVDMPNPPMSDEPNDEDVIGIEWSEAVNEEEVETAVTPSEPETDEFEKSDSEFLLDFPDSEPELAPETPNQPPIIPSEPEQNEWVPESEPIRAEPFEWDASADSATILDFDEIETETAVDPTPEQSSPEVDDSAKPHVAIDEPAKPKPNNRRTITILLTILILLCCCACGFIFFLYQIGGDWVLDQLGLLQ